MPKSDKTEMLEASMDKEQLSKLESSILLKELPIKRNKLFHSFSAPKEHHILQAVVLMLMEDNYKMRDGKFTALIAVRAGSTRVPKKI